MAGPDFFTINSKRAVMKVPVASLCMQAGIGRQTYYDALNGVVEPTASTVARLKVALDRFKLSFAGEPGPISLHTSYKLSLVVAAAELNADARAALAADPSQKATANREWRQAAQVRWLAFWIMTNLCGFKGADVARAAGVTKQAVSTGKKEIEDDPAMAAVIRRLEETFA